LKQNLMSLSAGGGLKMVCKKVQFSLYSFQLLIIWFFMKFYFFIYIMQSVF